MAANTYVALSTVTTNGSSTSYTFSNIPQTYTDLVLIIGGINSQSGGNMSIRFNGDTAQNYSRTYIYGDGTNSVSGRASSATALDGGGTNPNGSFVKWEILNYSNTSVFKTVIEQHVEPSRLVARQTGLWRSTTAINSIQVITQAALNSGQTISLYGIAADTGIYTARATGGTVSFDQFYVYHTFTSSDTFTPLENLSVDYLVIGGGGAGGGTTSYFSSAYGAGGGAGGYRTSIGNALLPLTAQNYTVTVGAGGTNSGTVGTNGSASVFGAIQATGGGRGSATFPAAGSDVGASGGSGGGGRFTAGAGNSGVYSPVEGYAGYGYGSYSTSTGGGGGASAAATSSVGANGASSSISGTAVVRAGGGGGFISGAASAGGSGGGGAATLNGTGTAGTPNTGGGGGAAGSSNASNRAGGAGGSGIVIVRYPR